MTSPTHPAGSPAADTVLKCDDEDINELCKIAELQIRPRSQPEMTPKDQPAKSTPPTTDDQYSDEKVGLDKLKIGEPSNKHIAEGSNFWIITFADEPFTENGHYCTGIAYTNQKEMVEWGFHKSRRWIAQGYKVDGSTEPTFRDLINKFNAHPEWKFGQFWPKDFSATWEQGGMSLNCKLFRVVLSVETG